MRAVLPGDRRESQSTRPVDHGRPGTAVLVVTPHRLDRDLLGAVLAARRDFIVVAAVGTRAELVAAKTGARPDVVLLELTGPAAASRLRVVDVRHQFADVPILAMTAHGEEECPILRLARHQAETGHAADVSPTPDCLAVAVMQGAHGAIRRTGSIEDLCLALHQVASGAICFDAGLSERLVRWSRYARGKGAKTLLSPREVDVARLIVGGHSNKEIAERLSMSEATAKKHVGHLMLKLELEDRLQLGLFLTRHRFLLEKHPHQADPGDS